MAHVGQIAMLRSFAGLPVPPENFMKANVRGSAVLANGRGDRASSLDLWGATVLPTKAGYRRKGTVSSCSGTSYLIVSEPGANGRAIDRGAAMLVWATEFPLRLEHGPKAGVDTCIRWLAGSPHYGIQPEELEGCFPESPDVRSMEIGGQRIQVGRATRGARELSGLTHARLDDEGREWKTEVTFSRAEREARVSVRVHCTRLVHSPFPPRPKKPYIVRLLLAQHGKALDGWLPVGDEPIRLDEPQVDDARRIVVGEARCALPIVYMSVRFSGGWAVDPDRLAARLGGVAHVVVEPSRAFSYALARSSRRMNVYGGALGVYWPDGGGQYRVFATAGHSASDTVEKIEDALRVAWSYAAASNDCTWDYLVESLAHEQSRALRESGSGEIAKYIEVFDSEMAAKDRQLIEGREEIASLRRKLAGIESRSDPSGRGLLQPGEEEPYYPGELQDAVVMALKAVRGQLQGDGRRQHIIDDLLLANELSEAGEEVSGSIKSVIDSSERIGGREKGQLADLGFTITEEGKHYKAVWMDDDRYTFSLPKSPSDHRAMKNLASQVVRLLFH